MIAIVVVLVVLGGLVAWFISIYNTLIRLIEMVNNNNKEIDVQLDRRFKVFESLIEVVKKYMDYEQTTLKDVIALRGQAQKAIEDGSPDQRMAAEDGISKIASNINVVFEQYPQLKADQNALQLQEEIVNTENKLAYAKQAYNDSVEQYNALKKSFIESLIVGMYSNKLDKEFVYWGMSADNIAKQEDYTVKM
jgi:LemA protein